MKLLTTISIAVVLSAQTSLACRISKQPSETQITLDPSYEHARVETKKNLSVMDLTACDATTKFVLIGSSVVFHQNDTARRETLLGDADPAQNNCRIELPDALKSTETPEKIVSPEKIKTLISQRKSFIDQCVEYDVKELSSRSLEFANSGDCSVTTIDSKKAQYRLRGSGCLIKTDPSKQIQISPQVSPLCLGYQLKQRIDLQRMDVETVVTVWPAMVSQDGQKITELGKPAGTRYVRYTVLPSTGYIPQVLPSQKEYPEQRIHVTAMGADVHFGRIDMRAMGANRFVITPTFYAKNNSTDYCQQGHPNQFCLNYSNYVTPIAADMELFQLDSQRRQKRSMGQWLHAVKVPAQFSGLAEVRPENNLSDGPEGSLILHKALQPGRYQITAAFFEPRSLMDNSKRSKDLFLGEISLPEMPKSGDESAIPAAPSFGINSRLEAFQAISNSKLAGPGFEFFVDRVNMLRNWTHFFSHLCNSETHVCVKLNGAIPFTKINFYFEVDASGSVKPLHITKDSSLFGKYALNITSMAQKVCQ